MFRHAIVGFLLFGVCISIKCPGWNKFGPGPPKSCNKPSDPLTKPKSGIESWFTEDIFNDLFQKANLGWGPNECFPYNYKAFIIAARYFPKFGTEHVTKDPEGKPLKVKYTARETNQRDLSAFFAHAIQETGENNLDLYKTMSQQKAHDCFYRGGFYNWFEYGAARNNGKQPKDGMYCTKKASETYCSKSTDNKWFYPCNKGKHGKYFKGCYFGRGAIQFSRNFNYGLFTRFLQQQGIKHNGKPINLLESPNLVMTKTDPPLSFMASLWFYMTPQSGIPSMHDIVIGQWVSPDPDYSGGVFGPTSLVINNECRGEDGSEPGGDGESRRIKAFRWFTKHFNVPFNDVAKTLSCKGFNKGSKNFHYPPKWGIKRSWDVDWNTSWDTSKPCECAMQTYEGFIPVFDPKIMPHHSSENKANKKWCEELVNKGWQKQPCAKIASK